MPSGVSSTNSWKLWFGVRISAEVPVAECFSDDNTCPLTKACRLRTALTDAANAFYATLDPITLDALVCDNPALMEIIAPGRVCDTQRADTPLVNAGTVD